MKRFCALILAVFVACYPVLAVEVEADDNGFDTQLSDVQAPADDNSEDEVPVEAVVDVSPLETVPVGDETSVPDDGSTVSADSDALSSADDGGVVDGSGSFALYDTAIPVPVTLVDDDTAYSDITSRASNSPVDIVDDPPVNPPFYGSGYITGTTTSGTTVTLYFPVNYKEGYFGVDSNGYLFNVSSTSITGYCADYYNNSVSVSGFSYPRYRTSSTNYDYTTLYIRPTASNMSIATDNATRVSVTSLLPYVSILLLGVIYLCCLRRS